MASWLQSRHQLPDGRRVFRLSNDDVTSVRTLADDVSAFERTISFRLDWCGVQSHMRLRIPAGFFAVLLAAFSLPAVAYSQPRAIEPGADFPSEDHFVWLFVEQGLKNQAAELQLVKAPESPETVALLLDADRPGDALTVLRRIVERRPERIAAAFKAASTKGDRFDDDGRGYPSGLREVVARARQRLRQLPREDAAEIAWYSFFLPLRIPGETWHDQLHGFLAEYAGTKAALMAELSVLYEGGDTDALNAALVAFARGHVGTVIGAQALYTAASNIPITQAERGGGDPTERLLRVAALARELQSGAYPICKWVQWAPQLVIGFNAPEPHYARENVPRVVAVFREFLLKNPDVSPVNPLGSGAGYFIAGKLPAVFAAGGGDPVAQVDRFLLDLETAVPEPAAVRFTRGLWYRQLADGVKDLQMKEEWRRKSDTVLLDLARAGSALYNRKALASLASIEFKGKNYDLAVERYREYLSRFPRSEWAWVAGLRIGQCEQSLGNWVEARQTFESVTSARDALPPALVLGHTMAGRASEALGDLQRARIAYERAERAWDLRFVAPYYGTYQFYTRLNEEPCGGCDPRSKSDVSREWLRQRSTQLKRLFSLPGGALLERGRFFVTEGVWWKAIAPLEEFIRLHPDSTRAAEAHELLTRAKLEIALLQAGPEATGEDKRVALAALESLAGERYGFSVFAANVARATLQSISGSAAGAAEVMSEALAQWHEHGAVQFAGRPTTALQRDVMDIRDAVFLPNAHRPSHQFSHLRSSDGAPPFFVISPDVRVKLHDDSVVRVEAASRLSAKPGALLLDEEQIAVLERILMGLGGTNRAPQSVLEHIQKFWNRFFTMGPGHWGGWILQTFPIMTEVTFIDAQRTRGAARIRTGYEGSTLLLTKTGDTWKVIGASGHWQE
jgi:tetratricopeptide (TPR) repeat protein